MIHLIIKDGLIHSAWDNMKDAQEQVLTLIDRGFNRNLIYIEEIAGTIPQNGQYYI